MADIQQIYIEKQILESVYKFNLQLNQIFNNLNVNRLTLHGVIYIYLNKAELCQQPNPF